MKGMKDMKKTKWFSFMRFMRFMVESSLLDPQCLYGIQARGVSRGVVPEDQPDRG
jgi:hypothetical protein